MSLFENFPYTNLHELNLDWMIKIAKDFLDQYTHIQELIENGISDITDLTAESLANLNAKAEELQTALESDIADKLADALADMQTALNNAKNAITSEKNSAIAEIITRADAKLAETLADIPDDYTTLANEVQTMQESVLFDTLVLDAKYQGKELVMDCADFPDITTGYYIDSTGEAVVSANHSYITFDGTGVTRIHINATGNVNSLNTVFIFDATGTLKKKYNIVSDWYSTYNITVFLPHGLPAGSVIKINDWYANSAIDSPFEEIGILYEEPDTRIGTGSNKFDAENTIKGNYYSYLDGTPQSSAYNWDAYGIAVEPDQHIYFSSGTKHIAFYTEYGVFVSGAVNSTSLTVPATAKNMIVSWGTNEVATAFVSINNPDTTYVPFGNKFKRPVSSNEGTRYEDYQEGQIHFNIPVVTSVFDSSEAADATVDNGNTVNVPAVLVLPNTYDPNGRATPLVIIFHGSGYGVSNEYWGWQAASDVSFMSFINNFVAAGYAVCDINGYTTGLHGTWGCPRVIQAYRKLYEYIAKNYNIMHEVSLYGFSMGGLNALNFACNNRDIVKCVAIGAAAVSVFDDAYNYSKSRKEGVADAFAFALPEGFVFSDGQATSEEITIFNNNAGKMVGFDPYTRIVDNTITGNVYPPIRAWHAKDDTAIVYTHAQTFVNAVRAGQGYASIRLLTTGGHGISYGSNQIVTDEIIKWLKRFN